MPSESRKYIKTLEYIIKVCNRWKEHIEEKTEIGKELLVEFKEEGILEVLSDLVLD